MCRVVAAEPSAIAFEQHHLTEAVKSHSPILIHATHTQPEPIQFIVLQQVCFSRPLLAPPVCTSRLVAAWWGSDFVWS